MMNIKDTIQQQIDTNLVVLYMKGSSDFPQCGFSARVVAILRQCEVEFITINVMDNDLIRQGIKTFSQWPTIPQLYVKGEFIGGCDIVCELHEQGKLEAILKTVSVE